MSDYWIRYKPLVGTAQEGFYVSKARYPAFGGGFGSGKTRTATAKLLTNHFEYPGPALIVVPTEARIFDTTIPMMRDVLDPRLVVPTASGEYWNKTERVVNTLDPFNKGQPKPIWIRSGDQPESLKGPTVSQVMLDEVQLLDESAFIFADQRCRFPGGAKQTFAVFTAPRLGRKHWTFARWGHRNTQHPEAPFFWMPTQHNWLYTKKEIEDWYWQHGGRKTRLAEQEMLGLWTTASRLVYEEFDPAVHVRPMPALPRLDPIAGGVDFAATSGITAVTVVGIDESNHVWWDERLYQRQAPIEAVLNACREAVEQYGMMTFHCDPPPTHLHLLQLMHEHGFWVMKAQRHIEQRITAIRYRLAARGGKPGLFVTPNSHGAIGEFQSWSYKTDADGTPTEQVELTGKDALDSGGYALTGLLAMRPHVRVLQGVT